MEHNTLTSYFSSEEKVRQLVVTLLGITAAVGIAYLVGTGQHVMLYLSAVTLVTIAVVGGLRDRAWVLILLAWSMSGRTAVLPLPISLRDLSILLVATAYLGHRIVAGHGRRVGWHVLDAVLAINVGYVAITFLMNPVGLRALGAETMGGRTYFNICLALVAYWVIVRLPNSEKTIARIPLFLVAGTMLITILSLISYFLPGVRENLKFLYAAMDVSAYRAADRVSANIPRLHELGHLGVGIIFLIGAYISPKTFFNPYRLPFYLLLVGLAAIMASGFRSYMLWAFAAVAISAWLHRGGRELLTAVVCGSALLFLVILGQGRLYELPTPAQRTLSFLPGDWSPIVEQDARVSSESRFEWWRAVISEGLIHNWWLGDGFGVSEADYQSFARSGNVYEWFTLTGGFHNGPLSTIRYVGLVGLVLFYSLMIMAAVWSVRIVDRLRDTPLMPAAVFVAIQLLWWPVHFTLVFGGYDSQMTQHIFLIALLRLLVRAADERESADESAPTPAFTPPHEPARLPV